MKALPIILSLLLFSSWGFAQEDPTLNATTDGPLVYTATQYGTGTEWMKGPSGLKTMCSILVHAETLPEAKRKLEASGWQEALTKMGWVFLTDEKLKAELEKQEVSAKLLGHQIRGLAGLSQPGGAGLGGASHRTVADRVPIFRVINKKALAQYLSLVKFYNLRNTEEKFSAQIYNIYLPMKPIWGPYNPQKGGFMVRFDVTPAIFGMANMGSDKGKIADLKSQMSHMVIYELTNFICVATQKGFDALEKTLK
jgi:hypothetical protein